MMWTDIKEHFRQAIELTPDAQAQTSLIVEMGGYGFFYPPRAIGAEPHTWPMMVETLLKDGPGERAMVSDIKDTTEPNINYSI